MNLKYILIFALLSVLAFDVGLVITYDRRTFQFAMAIPPFLGSVIIAYLSLDIYRKRIAAAESHYLNEVSRIATINGAIACALNDKAHPFHGPPPDQLEVPDPVSKDATRYELHYFYHSVFLVMFAFLDMVRIIAGNWDVGPSFTIVPGVLAGVFLEYIFVEWLLDWIVPT